MRTMRLILPGALALALAACAEPAPTPAAVPPPEPVDATPAPVSASAAAVAHEVGHDPAVVHFGGFGPAAFGADEEQVRIAWGRPLEALPPGEGASCYYLMPDPVPVSAATTSPRRGSRPRVTSRSAPGRMMFSRPSRGASSRCRTNTSKAAATWW